MKKLKKILLGCVLPLTTLAISVPIVLSSCSATPTSVIESKWKDSMNDIVGFSLNNRKNELIYDASADGNALLTLNEIKIFIYGEKENKVDKSTVSKFISDNIVDSSNFKTIMVENVIENKNSKLANFRIVLRTKDNLKISYLNIIVKNYLIDKTWSNKSIKENVASLSDDGKKLSVNLTKLNENDNWFDLNSKSNKNSIITAITNNSSDLQEKFKNLIDKIDKTISYNVTNKDEGNKIIFEIELKKESIKVSAMTLELIYNISDSN